MQRALVRCLGAALRDAWSAIDYSLIVSGFCGIYSPRETQLANESNLARMLGSIEHRGRRSRHTFVDAGAGLALGYVYSAAFLAPGEAPSPAWHEEAGVVLCVDGAIDARSTSTLHSSNRQTSSVLSAFREEQDGFLQHLNGYFSLALWDRQRKDLRIGTDRQGLRPLFYYHDPREALFVFGSEIKAVIAHPSIPRHVDVEALAMYLRIGCTLPPLTLFEDVHCLSAAESLHVDETGNLSKDFYWNPKPSDRCEESFDFLAARTRELVVDHVARLTAGSPNVAVFSSGGVESSVLLAALQERSATARSFTLHFERGRQDDLAWAAEAARQTQTPHQPVIVEAATITRDVLSTVFRGLDGAQDSSGRGLGQYFLSKAAAEAGVDSCLVGTGGERAFGSLFTWDRYLAGAESEAGVSERALIKELCIYETRCMSSRQQQRLLSSACDGDEVIDRLLMGIRQRIPSLVGLDLLNAIFFLKMGSGTTAPISELLPPLEGVEVRNGLIDAELFEFGRSLPSVLRRGEAGGPDRPLLRAAFAAQAPLLRQVLPRSPMPGLPWSGNDSFAKLEALVLRSVGELGTNPLFEPRQVEKLLRRYENRRETNVAKRLFVLFSFKVWHDFYVDGFDPFADLPAGW